MKARAVAAVLSMAVILGGCASTKEAVYRDALGRYADTGEAIVPLVKAETPGEQALLQAFEDTIRAVRVLQKEE